MNMKTKIRININSINIKANSIVVGIYKKKIDISMEEHMEFPRPCQVIVIFKTHNLFNFMR